MASPILGISLGTRHNGLAVVQGKQLEAAQVHSFNARWSKSKLNAILSLYDRYVREYHIHKMIVKIPKASHLSLAIKQIIRAIDMYVKQQGCLVEYTTITKIKSSELKIKNKRDLRKIVVELYPMLIYEMQKEIKNQQPYYTKIFEATIAAHIESVRQHK